MNQKKSCSKETLPKMATTEIYINVTHLTIGEYELLITDKNKVIQRTTFKKWGVNLF